MVNIPFFKKNTKDKSSEANLALDIGTESAKALVFKKEEKNIAVLGYSSRYFSEFEADIAFLKSGKIEQTGDFKTGIIKKTAEEAIKEIKSKGVEIPKSVFISLPADTLKGRVSFQGFQRKNSGETVNKKEEKEILNRILDSAKQEVSQEFGKKFGISPNDIHFADLKILEIRIDGYEVPVLNGYKGEKITFRILAVFLSKIFFKDFKNIFQKDNFKNVKFIHKAEGMISFLEFFPESDGIFLDIGERTTRIFLVKKGRLLEINEFKMGGNNFTQALSEKLGLTNERSGILKERYSKKILTSETSEKIKEILLPEIKNWSSNLKEKLSEQKLLTSKNVWLFGVGSRLPEIQEVLEKESFNPQYVKIPENIKLPEEMLNHPKYFSSILICYGV